MNTEIVRSCPACREPMRRDERPFVVRYRGQEETVSLPGWYCDGCPDGYHLGSDMKQSDRVLNRLKAIDQGLLEPKDIRRIRKKLVLTQEKAGVLLGGGPRAFQKYEVGDLLPSQAISNVLVLLDHDPGALGVLVQRSGSRTEARQAQRAQPGETASIAVA